VFRWVQEVGTRIRQAMQTTSTPTMILGEWTKLISRSKARIDTCLSDGRFSGNTLELLTAKRDALLGQTIFSRR